MDGNGKGKGFEANEMLRVGWCIRSSARVRSHTSKSYYLHRRTSDLELLTKLSYMPYLIITLSWAIPSRKGTARLSTATSVFNNNGILMTLLFAYPLALSVKNSSSAHPLPDSFLRTGTIRISR